MYDCTPIIITDTSELKDSSPLEYELYKRCDAHSLLAVPFWKNPVGFMIVRNPKRYNSDSYESGFLQALAFVAFSSVTEQKLLQRTQKAFSPEMIKSDKDILINLFGNIEIYSSKGVLTETEISSPRICRFLVYMLLNGKRPVSPRIILDAIWPNEDIDAAGNKIKSLAYRLQNIFSLISDYRIIISTPMGYQVNPELNIITDFQKFEEYWFHAQNTFTLQTKLELLKKAVALYHGSLYPAASSEHWIMNHELSYKYKCLGIYNEIMRIFYDMQDYSKVQYYASLALKVDKASIDAYYWMIRAMKQRGSFTMAKGELKMAEHVLTEDEYMELVEKLNKTNELSI